MEFPAEFQSNSAPLPQHHQQQHQQSNDPVILVSPASSTPEESYSSKQQKMAKERMTRAQSAPLPNNIANNVNNNSGVSGTGGSTSTSSSEVKMVLNNSENKVFLEKEFSKASQKVRLMVAKRVLTDSETTELEGLFSQATIGDGNNWKLFRSKTFFIDGNGKRASWLSLKGMPQPEAMERYIDLVQQLATKHYVIFSPSSGFSSRVSSSSSLATVATCETFFN